MDICGLMNNKVRKRVFKYEERNHMNQHVIHCECEISSNVCVFVIVLDAIIITDSEKKEWKRRSIKILTLLIDSHTRMHI